MNNFLASTLVQLSSDLNFVPCQQSWSGMWVICAPFAFHGVVPFESGRFDKNLGVESQNFAIKPKLSYNFVFIHGGPSNTTAVH